METRRNNPSTTNGKATSGGKKASSSAKATKKGAGKSSAKTRSASIEARDGAGDGRGGWTSRLSALANQAGETVRHIPEKASDVQHGIGNRLEGVVSGASSMQAMLLDFFPTLGGRRVDEREVIEAGLSRLKLLATLLDDLVEIPVIHKKIGLDPLIGMIPGAGRVVSPVISLYTVLEAGHIGAPPELLLKMLGRHVIDFIGSRIPVVGPLFDAWYKAHRLNVQELIAWFEDQLGGLDDDLSGASA